MKDDQSDISGGSNGLPVFTRRCGTINMRRALAVSCVVAVAAALSVSESASAGPSDGRLVVIGDSLAAGMVDLRQVAESQRWAYPTYVADRLGADYSTPEMMQLETDGQLRDGDLDLFNIIDLRSFFHPQEVRVPYDIPPSLLVTTKQRPDEEHTNLAVPGEKLAGAININDSALEVYHAFLNGAPYYALFGGGNPVSQLDIAIAMYPAPTTIIVDLGANDLFGQTGQAWGPSDPGEFDTNYRALMEALRSDNPDALIIGMNVPDSFPLGNNAPTASEADEIYGLPDGTMDGLLDSPAADSRFQFIPLLQFIRDGAAAPQPVTAVDQSHAGVLADAYNLSIAQALNNVGGVYIDKAAFFDSVSAAGLNVTIDGTSYHLDLSYGGGLNSLDGLHPTKTLHAVFANYIIQELNFALGMNMPAEDIDIVAASDKHVLRALGLDLLITPGATGIIEGDSGQTIVDVPVFLPYPPATEVTVDWTTLDDPTQPAVAKSGSDYVAASGTVTFAPGETMQHVSIEVLGDTVDEPPLYLGEWGLLEFSNPSSNAALNTENLFGLGLFVIVDDDPIPVIMPGFVSVLEGDAGTSIIEVPITLSHPSALPVTVDWATLNQLANPNVATGGSDYVTDSGTITFAPGTTAQTILIEVMGDIDIELDEFIIITTSNPTNATIGGFYGLGFGQVLSDD